jgi:hypothetical protein
MHPSRLLVVVAVIAVACDTPFQPRPPLTPSVPSPAPAPAPTPAPPAAAPSFTSVRAIEVGQRVVVPYLGWDDRLALFRLTAPASGTFGVQVKWREGQYDQGWYALTYAGNRISGDFELVARFQVVAGRTYEFTVQNTWPWDPDPGFVLTTWID